MARRGDDMESEPLQVVKGVAQGVDLQLAAVAGTGVHLADRQAAPEPSARGPIHLRAQFGQGRLGRGWRGDRQRQSQQILEQRLAHGGGAQRSWPEYEQLNDLLQSGKSATILFSMAASSSGHWNQDGSRGWQRATVPSSSSRSQTRMSPRKPSTSAAALAGT
jgi:hypothetical protein